MPQDREIRFSYAVLPAQALDEGEPNAQVGPVTRKILRAESALQQRVEFEGLVSRISSMFVTLKSEDLDWGISEALRQIGEFVRVDHAHVFQVRDGAMVADHTHGWSLDGLPSPMHALQNFSLDEWFPWSARRLRRLDGIAVYSVAELGRDAAVDQAVFRKMRLKSVVFIPMAVGGEFVGFLGFDSTRMEMQWTQDAIQLLNVVGAIIGDALRRKEAEDALRKEAGFNDALLKSVGALLIVLNEKGKIVRFNPAAEAATGWTSEEVLGLCPWDVFVPREEAQTMRRSFKRLAAGAPPFQGEGSLIMKSGHRRIISWSHSSLTNEDGNVEFVILSGLDVTETKRLEAEILAVAEREQSRFGHDLHDGLGQHLTGIEFMAQALQQNLESAQRPEAADAEEITKLIRQAIGHTRDLARGLSPLVLQSKGLSVALQDLAESVQKRHGILVWLDVGKKCEVTDVNKSTHLYRIAQEAINNAVKHGRPKKIVVELKRIDDTLELKIEDNGIGFSEKHDTGSGMGMRVMSYRASLIGGTVQISQLEQGVSVVCQCPA